MEIREQWKLRERLMVAGVVTIPALGVIWLHSSTPLNHTFRVTAIAFADIAVMWLLVLARRGVSAANERGKAASHRSWKQTDRTR
jgi:hypothetical protein